MEKNNRPREKEEDEHGNYNIFSFSNKTMIDPTFDYEGSFSENYRSLSIQHTLKEEEENIIKVQKIFELETAEEKKEEDEKESTSSKNSKFKFESFIKAFKAFFCKFLLYFVNDLIVDCGMTKTKKLKKAVYHSFSGTCKYLRDFEFIKDKTVKDLFEEKEKNSKSFKKIAQLAEKCKKGKGSPKIEKLLDIINMPIEEALKKFYHTEKFREFCKKQEKKYGNDPSFQKRKCEIFDDYGYLRLLQKKTKTKFYDTLC